MVCLYSSKLGPPAAPGANSFLLSQASFRNLSVDRIVDCSLSFQLLNLPYCTNKLVAFKMGRKNDSDPVAAEKEDADKQSQKPLPLPTVEESDEDDVEAGPMPPKALKRRKVYKFIARPFHLSTCIHVAEQPLQYAAGY